MGPTARVLFGLGLTWLLGLAASHGFSRSLRPGERTAWALASGLLLQSILVLLLAAARLPLRPLSLTAADALLAIGLALVTRRHRPKPPNPVVETPRAAGVLPKVLLMGALLAWLVFLVSAVAEPMWSTDYVAIWGLKGKTIFETGSVPARLFDDPALYWAHREYPLLVPLSLAALGFIAGEWDGRALAFLFPAAALATLLALSSFLARRHSGTAGAAAALLTALCFRLYHPVNAGTAEVVFALGAVLAASAFLDLCRGQEGTTDAGARVFVAALFCTSVKQEGTLWIALLGTLFFLQDPAALRKRGGRRVLAAFALPPAAHWLLLFVLRGPETRRDFDFHFFEPWRWPDLVPRFAGVCARIATTEAREAAIPLAAIALFILLTRRGLADRLWIAFFAQVFFYCIAFSVSSFDPMYAIEGAFRRIALTLFPTLTLVLCARLPPDRATALR